ncbi:MAG TPA: hypothetical protein VJ875_20890 [Pyrinomonadaceae bacterium]|nr:hypothetical protein [Pyrinomonadaceae bacterium]
MNKSEESANEQIRNRPNNADVAEITRAADNEKTQAQTTEPDNVLKYQLERLELENTRLSDENVELKDVHELRKQYIPNLFILTVAWLVTVIVIVWRAAEGTPFYLSDNVLVALITSTTVNVIGIFVIAARWLFPHKR